MTTVTPVSQATATSAAAASANIDYQMFLKLLVTEMQNQDPTKPMESTEYVAQLASFSNVEQSVQLNAKLEQLLSVSVISQAESLIGRTVTSPDGSVTGTVTEVKVYDDGLIAVLDSGEQIVVGGGVTIS
ncbi:MAG: flagellar hook assembly protein FlgD [Rhizobiaceae bacterium]